MARFSPAILALVLCLFEGAYAAAPITLINSAGQVSRSSIPLTSASGIVAVITSPGTPSLFGGAVDNVSYSADGDVTIISSPGATLSGTSPLSNGNGAAAASVAAGSIILSGITEGDLESSLDDTRHGHTLTNIFHVKLSKFEDTETSKVTLILAVPVHVDEENVVRDVESIFEAAKAEVGSEASFDDIYDIKVEVAADEDDVKKIMAMATVAASESQPSGNISATIIDTYSKLDYSSEVSPTITAAILSCDDAFSRHTRAARAKLTSWKSRVARGLTIDNFGSSSSQLMTRTMDSFDRDTLMAAGLSGTAAPYRLELRSKLQGRIESIIRELFGAQVEILEKSALKKFNAALLRKHGKDVNIETFYNDNAAAVRSAAFTFDSAIDDLEVPSLSLTKAKASQEMSTKLNSALLSFPDSPAARLKNMQAVTKGANKQKQPSEPSVDLGLDFVAMIRPDGFGNLQGFAGYQLGGNNIIVGVHNDADSPDVISQFGGKRPPFIRVQPKLKVDVEL